MARTDLMYAPAASSSRSVPGPSATAVNTSPKRRGKRVKPTLRVTTQFDPAPHRLKPHESVPYRCEDLSHYVLKWSRDFRKPGVLAGIIVDNALTLNKIISLREGDIEELARCRKDIEDDIRLLARKFRGIVHDFAHDIPSTARSSPGQRSTPSTSEKRTPEAVVDAVSEAHVPLPSAATDPSALPTSEAELPSAPAESQDIGDTADLAEPAAVEGGSGAPVADLLGAEPNAIDDPHEVDAGAAPSEVADDLVVHALDRPSVTYAEVGVQTDPRSDITADSTDDLREALGSLHAALDDLAVQPASAEDPATSAVVDASVSSPAEAECEAAGRELRSTTNSFLRECLHVSNRADTDDEDVPLATVHAVLSSEKTSPDESQRETAASAARARISRLSTDTFSSALPRYSPDGTSAQLEEGPSPSYDPPPYINAGEEEWEDQKDYREVPIGDVDAASWGLDDYPQDAQDEANADPENREMQDDVPIDSPTRDLLHLDMNILSPSIRPSRASEEPSITDHTHALPIHEAGRRMHWVAVPSPFTSPAPPSSLRAAHRDLSPLAMSSGLPTFGLPDHGSAHLEFTPALTAGGSAMSTPAHRGHSALTPVEEYSPLLRDGEFGAGRTFDSFRHDLERDARTREEAAGARRVSPESAQGHAPWSSWSLGWFHKP